MNYGRAASPLEGATESFRLRRPTPSAVSKPAALDLPAFARRMTTMHRARPGGIPHRDVGDAVAVRSDGDRGGNSGDGCWHLPHREAPHRPRGRVAAVTEHVRHYKVSLTARGGREAGCNGVNAHPIR